VTRVKICGITREDDALAAVRAGADAIGFVFWPGSERFIAPDAAASIAAALPPFVARVGVFVNSRADDIIAIRDQVGLSAIQLHGEETPEFLRHLPGPLIKAFRGRVSREDVVRFDTTSGFLIDGSAPGNYGGTGTMADTNSSACFVSDPRFILAGGLTPANVAERMALFRPAAVDVASGVEQKPGIKDAGLIEKFVDAVKGTDQLRRAA
jgi:phosphoribosylanthranilate isomerase